MDYLTGIPEIDETINARVEILSPTVRHLLKGDAIPTLVAGLKEKNGLTDDMQNGIEREITLILLYMEPVDTFATNLMTEYLVPPGAAMEIEKEVTAKLFAPIMNELGRSNELPPEEGNAPTPPSPRATAVPPPPAPVAAPLTTTPAVPSPAPHVPAARVMPHSKAELPQEARASTELPNALLQNLKAALMHTAPEEPLEGTNPAPSYNAILDPKPTNPPPTPSAPPNRMPEP